MLRLLISFLLVGFNLLRIVTINTCFDRLPHVFALNLFKFLSMGIEVLKPFQLAQELALLYDYYLAAGRVRRRARADQGALVTSHGCYEML